MTKRFLLQKIKRSIPISNDVIHPNFNKYYLNRYKNQPIIPITQQYSYAYQRKRKPPIFRNFETRFAEDQIGSIDHESARARTCTNTRIARIATSGTSACALSSLHDRVTPSSVALCTYVRTYEYTDDDRPTERPPSRAFQPTTTPVTKFDTNRRRRRFLPSCLPIGLRVRRVPKGGGGRRRTRFRSFGGCDSRNSSSRRPI